MGSVSVHGDCPDFRGEGRENGTVPLWPSPEQTIAVMQNVEAAWIAFKVLAAGEISPRTVFAYALRGGADFMVVGMFDFQVQQDAQLARDLLRKLDARDRPWRA